jgi:hypothetical protein
MAFLFHDCAWGGAILPFVIHLLSRPVHEQEVGHAMTYFPSPSSLEKQHPLNVKPSSAGPSTLAAYYSPSPATSAAPGAMTFMPS